MVVSAAVFEILTFKARKWLVFPPLSCLTPPARDNQFEFMDETYSAITRGMRLLYGANFIIVTSTVFD